MILTKFRYTNPLTYMVSKLLDAGDVRFEPTNGIMYVPGMLSEFVKADDKPIVLNVYDTTKPNKKEVVLFNPLVRVQHGQILAILLYTSKLVSDGLDMEDISALSAEGIGFSSSINEDMTVTYAITDEDDEVVAEGVHNNEAYALFTACIQYAFSVIGGLTEKDVIDMYNILQVLYTEAYGNSLPITNQSSQLENVEVEPYVQQVQMIVAPEVVEGFGLDRYGSSFQIFEGCLDGLGGGQFGLNTRTQHLQQDGRFDLDNRDANGINIFDCLS